MRTEPYDNKDGRQCWLSRDETEMLLKKASDDGIEHEIALSLGVRCGMRASEIIGVMPRNIDEHDQVGARLEIEDDVAKSDRPREVPLPTELKYAIRAHTDDHAPDEPIISITTTKTVERWVERAAEKCQAETGNSRWRFVEPHDLRRTWGTQLVEQEVEPGLIMEWGGWEDWKTFREHYLGAYSPEMERKQIEKVRWL